MAHHTTDPYTLARAAQQRAIRARRKRLQHKTRAMSTVHDAAAPCLPAVSPSQRQGRHAEDLALRHLQAAGLRPLARNLACRAGEIDLVCRDGDTLVFIEVRQRFDLRYGGAAASIGHDKQQRLIKAAHFWLPQLCRRHFQGRQPPCRFDAVVLEQEHIHWIRHAFTVPASR